MEIYGATEQEAGLYTCTAHSLVGADLKTVTVAVGSYVPDPFKQPVNINIRSVQIHSVLVFWENSSGWAMSLISWCFYLVCVHLRSAEQEVHGNCINVTRGGSGATGGS